MVFMICLLEQTYSQDYFNNDIDNLSYEDDYYEFNKYGLRELVDVSARFFYPPIDDYSFFSIDFGFGVGIDVFPYILSPGIYFDIGIGGDWFALFSSDDKDTKKNQEEKENPQIGFSAGLRLYNIINIKYFNIIPFIGYNFLYFYYPLPNAGISLSYKYLAIEYAYYIPTSYEPVNHSHLSIKITKQMK
ncbi:hypothetical protein ACYULU_10850 [Breznakiellaceae bacterium SP9]